MRMLFVLIVALTMTMLLAPIALVARLVGVKEKPGSIYERCMRTWARALDWAAGVRVRVHGREHIPASGGATVLMPGRNLAMAIPRRPYRVNTFCVRRTQESGSREMRQRKPRTRLPR